MSAADDNALRSAFQVELEALERWRLSYASAHPKIPLHREDPDVRRLVEALALFSARTRLAAERSVTRTSRRLFRQHFGELLSPVPAQALLQGLPSSRYTELDGLPRGTEVALSQNVRVGVGQEETRQFRFTTQSSLDLLPLRLTDVEVRRPFRQGPQLLLELTANHEFRKVFETLSFLVSHSADFASSLNVYDHLHRHAVKASCFVGRKPDLGAEGKPSPLRFGRRRLAAADQLAVDHPVQQLRSALAYPAQLLYFHVDVDIEGSDWWRLYLQIDLDEDWPLDLDVALDSLHLGAVPVANLVQGPASPIEVDGTRERYAVVHPETDAGFRAHSVIGAYRFTDDGPLPLWPGVLGGQDTYELSSDGVGTDALTWIHPELVARRRPLDAGGPEVEIEALVDPVTLGVDAFWHQPGLARMPPRGFDLALRERFVEGVSWRLIGDVSRPQDNPLANDAEGLLRLVALRSQRFLDGAGLRFLLTALGAGHNPHFAPIVDAITEVGFERAPSGRSSTGFKYACQVELDPQVDFSRQALRLLQPELLALARSWNTDEVLSVDLIERGRGVVLGARSGGG